MPAVTVWRNGAGPGLRRGPSRSCTTAPRWPTRSTRSC